VNKNKSERKVERNKTISFSVSCFIDQKEIVECITSTTEYQKKYVYLKLIF